MITRLHIENFRGFERSDIDIAPITIFTGGNNTGKSSVMYALLALKNIVSNPNQPLDSFFNFLFMNLGGFKETVHLKEEDSRRLVIGVQCCRPEFESTYRVELGKTQSTLSVDQFQPAPFQLRLDVTFPCALNLNTGTSLGEEYGGAKITWNGISATVSTESAGSEAVVENIVMGVNGPAEDIKGVDFVPLKRGFIKPVFSPVPLQPQLVTEDEIATTIANDRDLEGAVSFYLERIVNKSFQARPVLGASSFYLQTTDRGGGGFVCDLVNDGFGTSQLVYLLAKALRKGQTLVCIEEPEIHLHPQALLRLAEVLIEIAKEKHRRFLISTHSEHFVMSLLNKLRSGVLEERDLRVYYLRKEKVCTVIEEQQVNSKGQIEGGLKGFYETELEQMREFLQIGSRE